MTQWPKEKEKKNKQRSTKHTHKTKDRVTQTLVKTGCELMCCGKVSSSCSNARQIINRNPDDPLNREFTLDVIKQGTKIPPPSGQGLVNRNTLIHQEYKDTRNRYLITFFSCISYMMNLI
jgi:hypothetical protein